MTSELSLPQTADTFASADASSLSAIVAENCDLIDANFALSRENEHLKRHVAWLYGVIEDKDVRIERLRRRVQIFRETTEESQKAAKAEVRSTAKLRTLVNRKNAHIGELRALHRKEVAGLHNSLRHRLGGIVIAVGRNPLLWPALPFRLFYEAYLKSPPSERASEKAG